MFTDPEIPGQEFPDEVDLVVEVADMMTVFAAQRLVRVDRLRREALRDAARNGRVLTEVVERGIRLELAAALRISEHAAGDLLMFAELAVQAFPGVLGSLERARMTEDHARFLVTSVHPLEPRFQDEVLQAGIRLAETEPVGTFRRKLRALIDTVRSQTLTERYEQALTGRRIWVEATGDGMGWAHVYAPIVELQAAFGRATRIAKTIVGRHATPPQHPTGTGTRAGAGAGADRDPRTLDQARTDVFLDLLNDGTVTAHPDTARGIRATTVVTVPALALLEDTDESRTAAGIDPPVVEGIGPIPLTIAKRLAGGDQAWLRVLTHPETGMVLSVGRDRHDPPASLTRLVKWRADRCLGPGCGMPASRCDIDHHIDWALGGPTALTNLGPLCEGHHTVRHHTDWTITPLPGTGGAVLWTSPTGRHYIVHPERPTPTFHTTPPIRHDRPPRKTTTNHPDDAPF